jgi:MIP family channel proteins
MNGTFRPALAELIGTFTLTFIGAGAGALAGFNLGGIVAVALAHGIALMVIVYTWGTISGAHVNPAVTFGLAVGGRISWPGAVRYWIAQFLGAAIAGYVLVFLLGDIKVAGKLIVDPSLRPLGQTVGELTFQYPGRTVLVEAILTFFLVCSVYANGVANRFGNAVGLAIGMVLAMDILMGGFLTGASMNPARTFGPALAMNDWSYLWMYLVGPLLGGGAAGLLYNSLYMDDVNAN